MTLLVAVLAAPLASADEPAGDEAESCRYEVEVQFDPAGNEHECKNGCEFSVVVQVGWENSTTCNDVCRFNVFVQVGVQQNKLECGTLEDTVALLGGMRIF